MVSVKNTNTFFNTLLLCLSIFLFVSFSSTLYGQVKDTSVLLLSATKVKNEPFYFIKQPNVLFPEILKGNELNSSEYIASYSTRKRNYLVQIFNKGKNILPKVNELLKKNNLPKELGILMLMESEGNANALSKAGAVGYWQIMDVVAKEYGLKYVPRLGNVEKKKLVGLDAKKTALFFKVRGKLKDDRKNFSKSTLTAARYLNDARESLDNDWLLVVASYNCGLGNVRKAIRKSGKKNPLFWDIKKFLPSETQSYVMNFITLSVIYHNYEKFYDNNLNFTPVKILIPGNYDPIQTMEGDLFNENPALQN